MYLIWFKEFKVDSSIRVNPRFYPLTQRVALVKLKMGSLLARHVAEGEEKGKQERNKKRSQTKEPKKGPTKGTKTIHRRPRETTGDHSPPKRSTRSRNPRALRPQRLQGGTAAHTTVVSFRMLKLAWYDMTWHII